MSADDLRLLVDALVPDTFQPDDIIYRVGEPSRCLYFVVRGRVEMTAPREGSPDLVVYADRGDHFGEVSLLTGGRHTTTARAVLPTQVLQLDAERFDRLLAQLPLFSANLSLSLVSRFRSEVVQKRRRQPPAVVCLVNSGPLARRLAPRLAARLAELGESIHVVTDRGDNWPAIGVSAEPLASDLSHDERLSAVLGRVQAALAHHDRVLFDIRAWRRQAAVAELLVLCDEIWWLADPAAADAESLAVRRVIEDNPTLASRIRFVWALPHDQVVGPRWDRDLGIAALDFKMPLGDHDDAPDLSERQGLSRLVRHLRGTRLGLAMGGGGARGMAHLGVLKVLNREGIFFDHLAGTSSGALLGMSYAFGWTPENALLEFRKALSPSKLFRLLPGGHRWYLMYMFRTGAWDRMLRPFLHDTVLEQFPVPLATVTVDLITGEEVIRERGDAIHAVLESINIPVISRPILRDRALLVDGAVLNNLPGSVLQDRDIGYVVGIDVVAKLPLRFAGNTPDTPAHKIRRPAPIQTLLRVDEVQAFGMTAMRTGAVDFLITPETSLFEFADFTRSQELAEAGEAAAEEIMPQLKQALADFERRATTLRANE